MLNKYSGGSVMLWDCLSSKGYGIQNSLTKPKVGLHLDFQQDSDPKIQELFPRHTISTDLPASQLIGTESLNFGRLVIM